MGTQQEFIPSNAQAPNGSGAKSRGSTWFITRLLSSNVIIIIIIRDAPTIATFKDKVKLVNMGNIIEKAHFKN